MNRTVCYVLAACASVLSVGACSLVSPEQISPLGGGVAVEAGADAPRDPTDASEGGAPDAAGDVVAEQDAPLPQAATPAFDPPAPPGGCSGAYSVAMTSATPGAMIRFTIDGSMPNGSSPIYTNPIAVSGALTLWAFAQALGYRDSVPQKERYDVGECEAIAPPWVAPSTATYNNDFIASLNTTTAGATICYTTDNTPPTCDSTTAACGGTARPYDASKGVPITWLGSTGSPLQLTLRALACKAGGRNSQEGPSTVYTLSVAEPLLTESSTVPMGSRILARSITRATPTPAAQFARLHYTVDSAIPTCTTSTVIMTPPGTADAVSGSIGPITTTTTVSVIGCKEGYNPSNVVSRTYGVE